MSTSDDVPKPSGKKLSFELKSRGEEIKRQAQEIEEKMSIRAKITVSLLVVLILILPVVGMTLHYFAQMRGKVDIITSVDAKLIDLANRIDESMLLAKRAESNFILLRDSLYVKHNQEATQRILALCTKGKEIAAGEEAILKKIAGKTRRYQSVFTLLVTRYHGKGVREQIKALQRGFAAKFTETLTRYNAMLAAAKKERVKARRDSLMAEADRYLRSFSIDDLTVGMQTKHDPEMTSLLQILSDTSEEVRNLAKELEKKSWQQLERHRKESRMLVARAQRNITVVLILTVLVSAYLLFILPSRIVKPISAITNIIKRAERGDYDVTAKSASKDEVGQLALFLNRMLKQVRTHDTLKTEKIFTQQKKVEALADAVPEGVLILNHEREVTLINRSLEQRLGWQRRQIINKPLSAVDVKGELNKAVVETLDKNIDVDTKPVHLLNADSKESPFEATIHVLRNEQTAVFAILIVLRKEKKRLVRAKRA